jgi:hypothetical protein
MGSSFEYSIHCCKVQLLLDAGIIASPFDRVRRIVVFKKKKKRSDIVAFALFSS